MASSENERTLLILQAVASGLPVTQRSLAGRLGVAVGLANLLVRRLVAKGYLRVSHMGSRHVRYLLTADGWEALTSAARVSLENTMHLYTETREKIRAELEAVSALCAVDTQGRRPIVFYGAGDIAEIAYVSLQATPLTLVGIVDDTRTGRFFHLRISGPDQLFSERIGSVPYGHLVVTSIRHADSILARVDERAIPRSRVSRVEPRPEGLASQSST
jgi:DNA-binding MarR family transcriptional regulator